MDEKSTRASRSASAQQHMRRRGHSAMQRPFEIRRGAWFENVNIKSGSEEDGSAYHRTRSVSDGRPTGITLTR